MHLTALRLAAAIVASSATIAAAQPAAVAQSTAPAREPAMTHRVSTEVDGIAADSRGTVHAITRFPSADVRIRPDGSSDSVKLDPSFYPIGVGVTTQDTVWIAFSVNRGPSRKSLFAAVSPTGRVRNVPVPRSAAFVRGRYAAYGMAPTPDGRFLWYSGMDDRITRLALATMTTVSFARDKRQNQLTVDGRGAGWFPSGHGDLNSVAEGSRSARTYAGVIPPEAGSVLSMSASQDGTLWFVTARDHHIHWFDPQSNARGDCAPDANAARGPGRVQGLRDSAVYTAEPAPVEIARDCTVRATYHVRAPSTSYLSYSAAAGVLAVEGGNYVAAFNVGSNWP